MKKYFFMMALAVSAVIFAAFSPAGEIVTIALGTTAPKADVKMKTTKDNSVSLNDVKKANGLLVVFSCNTCPFVVGSEGSEGWEGRFNDVKKSCDANNVGMILINSNEAKREGGDDLASMKSHASEKGYADIIYALDQNSELANAFGAKTTPHAFLFDKNMKLVYRGSIDDNVEAASKVSAHYVKNALTNLAAGKAIEPADTRPMGCSIKRK